MNLREGTRRLALLLGMAGAILGGIPSYSILQSDGEQRTSHNTFEQWAASPVVQQTRHSIKMACAQDPSDKQCGDETYAPMSEVNSGGIKTIYWSKDFQPSLIQTQDGESLFPVSPPSGRDYPLIALFPILGFFLAWGAVRAIGWVVAGFGAGSK